MTEQTAKQRHRADVLRRGPRIARCALRHRGACAIDPFVSTLEADHVVELQWLRLWLAEAARQGVKLDCPDCEGRGWQFALDFTATDPFSAEPRQVPCLACPDGVVTLDRLTADGRNGWMLCERHHGLKTRALLTPSITRAELPPVLWSFTDEFKCAHLLDRKPFAVTS